MKKLLLIDDDEKLAAPLKVFFSQYDFELLSQTHPIEAIQFLKSNTVDVIILDVMLPEIDGFEACRRIRQFSDIPIIMLTARGDVMDRVVGLELGADDYLPKPFEPRELVARIQNILKRTKLTKVEPDIIYYHGLTIDQPSQRVEIEQKVVELTSAEYRVLLMLALEPQKVFSRDEIMNIVNGIDADIFSRAIDVLVSRLRHKLKPLEAIKTVRSQGYQFILSKK